MVLSSKTSSAVGLLVAAAILYLARDVLIPLALAILLSFLLAPLVRRLEHWSLGRVPSTVIAVVIGFSIIGGIGLVASRQALSLAAKLPEYRENIREKIHALRAPQNGTISKAAEAIKELENEAAPGAAAPLPVTETAPSAFAALAGKADLLLGNNVLAHVPDINDFVGGMKIPLIRKFEAGYAAGVRHVCPDCQVLSAYAGTEPKAFADPPLGQDIASAQYGKGADIIYHAAGKTGDGVFAAAKQRKARAIGVDSNQNMVKPGFVLTSMVKRVDNAVYDIVNDVVNRRFSPGLHVFGLDKDGVGYAMDEFNKDLVSPEALEAAEAAKKKIIAGEIKVTDAMGS